MMTIEQVDFSGFTAGLEGLIVELGISAPKVVKHEVGELISTLVRVTPPNDMAKSRKAIDDKVDNRLEAANTRSASAGKYALSISSLTSQSTGDVNWYAVTPQLLYGVVGEKDLRKSDIEDIRKVFLTLSKHGRQILSFKHPRKGGQRVALTGKIVVKLGQKTSLKARLKKSLGRLKAGWCASYFAGVITIARGVPKYVARHAQGVRGRFNDGTSNKELPYFEIANSALGVDKTPYYLDKALDIRAKAMVANTALFASGKKHLSDYAKHG